MDALERFERELALDGESVAPNGATYRMTLLDIGGKKPALAVERTYKGESEHILGFNGFPFEGATAARAWASSDGRCEMPEKRGTPLSGRKVLA